MKILAVQETDWIERNPIIHHRLLEALSRAGDEVVVIDFDIHWHDQGRWPIWQKRSVVRGFYKYFGDSSITLIRPGMLRVPGLGRISWLIANWKEMRRLLRGWKPDVVVAYGISNALLAHYMAKRASVPFVYHLLDSLHALAEPARLRPLARAVEAMTMRRADKVIVINRHLREYALSMGADDWRVEVLPVGWTRGKPLASAGEGVRRRLSIGPEEFLLVFVGWLYRFSGMREVAIELARRADEVPTVKCLVVGDGDLLDELRHIGTAESLNGRLLVIGRRPQAEIAGYIAAADACLLPAHRVPAMEHIVPAKVGEYMELGKPVIATRLPGLVAEFGSVPGLRYIDRPEDAIDRVQELLGDPRGGRDAARRLGHTCLEFVRAHDDWDHITKRFRAALSSPVDTQMESWS